MDANFTNIIVQFHLKSHISQKHNKKKRGNKLYAGAVKDKNLIKLTKILILIDT